MHVLSPQDLKTVPFSGISIISLTEFVLEQTSNYLIKNKQVVARYQHREMVVTKNSVKHLLPIHMIQILGDHYS